MATTAKAKHIFSKPWQNGLAALIGFGVTYGLASWSIDSGRLLVYAATIVALVWSIKFLIRALTGNGHKD